ncbi:MAG: hypothetical protein PHI34_14575, partial [Acidobacteriota bacterium]|nr:hypothetical protein [Acidobacteriota bacterium]
VLAGACRKANETRAEKAIENAMEKASGGKADVDLSGGKISVKTDEGKADIDISGNKMTVKTEQGTSEFSAAGGKWPADVPGDVPKLEAGKITATLRGAQGEGKTWTIAMSDIEENAYVQYVEKIKAAGYEIITSMSIPDGAITQARKGAAVINLTFGKNTKTLALTIVTGVE